MPNTSPFRAAFACAAALIALAGTASAAITVYTDATLYATATGGSGYTEDFSTTAAQDHPSPLSYSGGTPTVTYVVATRDGSDLWRNAFNFDYGTWLGTYNGGVTIDISFTSGNVKSVGGNFFLSDAGDAATDGNLDLFVNGSATPIATLTSVSTGTQPFLGIIATGGDTISSLSVTPSTQFLSFTNFNVGTVPEPTGALLGCLGAVALLRRRRA